MGPLGLIENANSLPGYCCCPCPSLHNHRITLHVIKLKSTSFFNMTVSSMYSNSLQRIPFDLNPTEHLCYVVKQEGHIMDMQTTNLQQLHLVNTDLNILNTSNLVESMPRRIKANLKPKGCPSQC